MADQLGLEAQKIDENVFIFNHGAGYEEIFDIIIECLDGYEVTEEKVDDELFELYAEKKKKAYKIRIDFSAEEIKVSVQETEVKKY